MRSEILPPGATSGNRTPLQSALLPQRGSPVLSWFYIEYRSPSNVISSTGIIGHLALCCFPCETLVLAPLSFRYLRTKTLYPKADSPPPSRLFRGVIPKKSG
jgi:hypothetical protein